MNRGYGLLAALFIVATFGAYHASKEASEPSFLIDTSNQLAMSLSLSSPAFEANGFIPEEYSCDGRNVNPPLAISGIPEETVSLVLVMDDPDIPEPVKEARGIEKFNHWAIYNLPPDITEIAPGAALGSLGENSRGELSYTGPCPPPDMEPLTHRYMFRLYALSDSLSFLKAPTLDEIETAAAEHIIEKTELIGRYTRADAE